MWRRSAHRLHNFLRTTKVQKFAKSSPKVRQKFTNNRLTEQKPTTKLLVLKEFFAFSLPKRKFDSLRIVESKDFPIFAPAIPGEIGVARESAFFALFLSSESGQFT